jgi:flagellar hook-basal body complex protein FliE
MSISAIGPILGATSPMPAVPAPPSTDVAGAQDFGQLISRGLDQLQSLHDTTNGLALQAATGDLTDVHDYMIASQQSGVATELTVAVRNRAVEAFTEIMRMQI